MLRRSPLGIIVGAVITVAVVGFGISNAIDKVGDAKNGIEQASGSASSGAGDGDSLIKAANFGKAIAAVKGKTGANGELLELRLEPKEAKFQVRDGDGAKGWTYTSGGDLEDFKVKLIGPGQIEDNVFPIEQLQPGVPERIVAGIQAKNSRYELADVQFMTLDIEPVSGKFVWSVNIGDPGSGDLYQADLDGTNVRAPGEAGRDVADCIAKAAGDAAKIGACATQ